jgi:fumarate reductase flavoprotein subunit
MTTKVMDCDLVVLGAGGAGLVAAVKASEDGVKKVIIFEKAKKPGGATYFANGPGVGSQGGGGMGGAPGGMPGGQSGAPGGGQGAGPGGQGGPQGMPGGMGGGQSTGSGFSSWFTAKVGEENMVKTPRMEKYKDLPDPSIGPGRGGTFTVLKMVEFCQKQGIQIFYETPAKKFITDVSGKITGVLADAKDGQVQVNCKACVIAAGGFGRNYEKLKKYWPDEYNNKEIFFLCPPGMMGDGIDMAEAAGAYIDQTKWNQDVVVGFIARDPIHHPYSWAIMEIMQNSMFACINLDGKRWKKEGVRGISLCNQPGGVAYYVGDNDMVEAAGKQAAGGSAMEGMAASAMRNPDSDEYKAIHKWKEDLEYEVAIDEEGAKGNHVKKANSLVELALKMDVDPKTFVETIERYNKFCETGKDLDFGKDAQYLKPIRKPPFWAIYGHRFSQCTKGLNGIAVNPDYEVLSPKGETMPGLFAAGDTCTIYGRSGAAPSGGNILSTTPFPCNGSTMALASGYSAGVRAAEYLKKI